MSKNPIGLCDSGLGGLSVWLEIIKLLPNESTVYIGDHAYLPYGSLTTARIRKRTVLSIQFLLSYGCKIIVIACNTATVAGIGYYRNKFPEIPIIGVVPVVKTAVLKTKTRQIAIMSTAYTATSQYQKSLLVEYAGNVGVTNIACSNLVTFIENGDVDDVKIVNEVQSLLLPLKNSSVDILVLGCTHYPFIRACIENSVGPGVSVIDSGQAVARHIHRILFNNHSFSVDSPAIHQFFTTGDAFAVTRAAGKLTGRVIQFKAILHSL